jgi:putative cardiolipin synthase
MALRLFILAPVIAALTACGSIDRNHERIESAAYAPSGKGIIARTTAASTARFPQGHAGFHLLEEAEEALDWRLALTDHATRSIDIQYYLWNTDETGLLLLSRLLDAAERGVRVRLLIDDLLFADEEERLAALCHHPNFQIRIYNPKFARAGGIGAAMEILLRFEKLNRRMHNKVFCVDNGIAILGGRNIGNEYFGLSQDFNFVDLDVMTAGPIVREISDSFDLYWNSELSYPGEAFSPEIGSDRTAHVYAEIRQYVAENRSFLEQAGYPVQQQNWSREFSKLVYQWHPGSVSLIDDAPSPDLETRDGRFVDEALGLVGEPSSRELLFSSPYLIPRKQLHQIIRGYTEKGVEVKLLTASLGANNHLIVHSHYRKHRRDLLADGVRLFEMREDSSDEIRAVADVAPVRSDTLALHVKAGVGDGKRCFIGSLNLDPRSIELNTENGLLIESPSLARELEDHLEMLMSPDNAWEVTRENGNRLRWRSRGEEVTIQPAPDSKSRVMDFFLGLLPVEGLL